MMLVEKVKVVKAYGYHFYKVYNFLPEEELKERFTSATKWLEENRKPITEEVFPPEASWRLLELGFDKEPLWKEYYKRLDIHIKKYCEIIGLLNNTIELHSSWITRLKDLDFEGEHDLSELYDRMRQHSTKGNMHAHHKFNPITTVYYLTNPHPKYGTSIKFPGDTYQTNVGQENSLIIFDGRLEHSAIYPPLNMTQKHPRITVVADYAYIDRVLYKGD